MRITILRHGQPAFEPRKKVRAKDLEEISRSYDLSGVADTPPSDTSAALKDSKLVVCSHLMRSIESANALGFSEVHIKDPLFRETGIPHFRPGYLSLPINAKIAFSRFLWLFGISENGESRSHAKNRAELAAARLVELAEEHQDVLLVGHDFFNQLIARELRNHGWSGPSKPGNGFWEYGIYERAATTS
jgi:broad specificity phosphatase PhoE